MGSGRPAISGSRRLHTATRKMTFAVLICIAFILAEPPTSRAQQARSATDSSSRSEVFKTCSFDADDGVRISYHAGTVRAGSSEPPFSMCFARPQLKRDVSSAKRSGLHNRDGYVTLNGEGSISVIISAKTTDAIEEFDGAGFRKGPDGKWSFHGNPVTTGEVKFKELRTTALPEAGGITLVGRQIELGFTQTGAPISFLAAFIVRETADFFVETSIAFDPKVSPQIGDLYIRDLINIVQSVRIARK